MDTANEERALRVAVVGAGPAGLYLADALLRSERALRIDLYERLPTPFGLLRYGVAPDHLKIKSFIRVLQGVLDDDRVQFFGNVVVGDDVSVDALRKSYHAVVYAAGASSDKRLAIDGEDLPGSVSAAQLVKWYSGHPDVRPDSFDLTQVQDVVIVGAGNVALDVSRILAKRPQSLRETDIPMPVLERLTNSAIRDIHVIARRAPRHMKFSTNELREFGELEGVDLVVDPSYVQADSDDAPGTDPVISRNLRMLREWSTRESSSAPRRLHFHFGLAPVAVQGSQRVEAVRLARTPDSDRATNALITALPAQLLVRCIGYQGAAIDGIPFDAQRRIIPNISGRVVRGSSISAGEYAVGWISRGATGQLGTNRADGDRVAEQILCDADLLLSRNVGGTSRPPVDLEHLACVDKVGWATINVAEIALGRQQGRARSKIGDWDALLRTGAAV